MKYRVVLTARAERELELAAGWWARNRSPVQASQWYAGFSEAIDSLEKSPESHPLSTENDKFIYELRDLYYGLASRPTHRAVFTIRSEMVLVLTIRHFAQAELTEDDLP